MCLQAHHSPGYISKIRTEVPVFQGMYGLGIMIVEGKHAVVGQGIFITDVQIGSVAEKVRKKTIYRKLHVKKQMV